MKTSTVLDGNQQTKRSLPHKNSLHSDCSKNSFVNKAIGNWAKEINSKNPVKISHWTWTWAHHEGNFNCTSNQGQN